MPSEKKVRGSECGAEVAKKTSPVEVFREAFNDHSIYQNAECEQNARRLLLRFRKAGFDLNKAAVLYLSGPAGMPVLEPRNPFSEWGYHVVVLLDKRVYDLDFGASPRVLPLRSYMKANIIDDNTLNSPTALRRFLSTYQYVEVPAAVFMSRCPADEDDDKARARYLQFLEVNYPTKPLSLLWK